MNAKQKINSRGNIWSKIWYGFFLLYFLNMVVVATVILLMKPLWYDINEFLIGMIGVRFNWFAIILSLLFIIFAHSIYLVIKGAYEFARKGISKSYWITKVIPFIFLPVWDFALNMLFSEAGEETVIVKTQLEYFSPIFWLILVIGISAVSPFLYKRFSDKLMKLKTEETKWYTKTKYVLGTLLIGVLCIFPFISPFFLIPSTVIDGAIPPKPLIIAHRGASHLAPENTLVAAEQAVAFGADGIEVDLTISYDGVIFLLHDDTLRRTTNVAEAFPERAGENAALFNFSELRSLDAGSWFVDSDPFNTIKDGYISESTAESYRGELIPSLEEIINFTRDNGLLLDIDAKGPPSGHPYDASFNNILLTQLNNSGMGKDILLGSSQALSLNMTYVTGALSVDQLIILGSELVNTHHGLTNKQFREYEESGIQVMAWTIDSVSRFSQLWCLGVDIIKTNNLHIMVPLSSPIWNMDRRFYYLAWILLIIITPAISFTLDYFVRKIRK